MRGGLCPFLLLADPWAQPGGPQVPGRALRAEQGLRGPRSERRHVCVWPGELVGLREKNSVWERERKWELIKGRMTKRSKNRRKICEFTLNENRYFVCLFVFVIFCNMQFDKHKNLTVVSKSCRSATRTLWLCWRRTWPRARRPLR